MKRSALIAVLLAVLPLPALGGVREYERVDFGALHWLSKGDIVQGAGIARRENRIVVDREKLENYLSKESMVKSYKLIDKNSVLTILVSEREPFCTAALRGKNRTVLCTVDREGRVIAAGRSFRIDAPLVAAYAGEARGLPAPVQNLIAVFGELKKRPVWRELGQVTLRQDGLCDVLLKGRPTTFTAGADFASFVKIEALAGQFDREGRYPRTVSIRDGFAVAGTD